MDPNEALRRARAAAATLRQLTDDPDADPEKVEEAAEDLREHFEALDGWVSNGGVLPRAWVWGR